MYLQPTSFRPAALNRCSGRLLVPAPAAAIRLMKMCVRHSSLSLKVRVLLKKKMKSVQKRGVRSWKGVCHKQVGSPHKRVYMSNLFKLKPRKN